MVKPWLNPSGWLIEYGWYSMPEILNPKWSLWVYSGIYIQHKNQIPSGTKRYTFFNPIGQIFIHSRASQFVFVHALPALAICYLGNPNILNKPSRKWSEMKNSSKFCMPIILIWREIVFILSKISRFFGKKWSFWNYLSNLFPSIRHMGNKLDIFEMVMVTFAGGMVRNVQILFVWLALG